MSELVGIVIMGAICWYCYQNGKREGSRKGYFVGRISGFRGGNKRAK